MGIRIAVIGLGAVGGFLGGLLARFYKAGRGDVEIHFIARGGSLRNIRDNGLIVKSHDETWTCHPTFVTDNAEEVGPVDYILIATKAYDVLSAVSRNEKLLKKGTVMVPFLNGVFATEQLRKRYPEHAVWWGCVYIYAKKESDGVIYENTNGYKYMYGPGTDSGGSVEELDRIFSDAGICAQGYQDIERRVWEKYAFVSSIAAVSSYTQLNFGEILANSTFKEMYVALVDEFYSVAEKKGIVFEKEIRKVTRERMRLFPPETTSSMQRDFASHHATELESLIGYVVREGERLGVDIPVYKNIYTALKCR